MNTKPLTRTHKMIFDGFVLDPITNQMVVRLKTIDESGISPPKLLTSKKEITVMDQFKLNILYFLNKPTTGIVFAVPSKSCKAQWTGLKRGDLITAGLSNQPPEFFKVLPVNLKIQRNQCKLLHTINKL